MLAAALQSGPLSTMVHGWDLGSEKEREMAQWREKEIK